MSHNYSPISEGTSCSSRNESPCAPAWSVSRANPPGYNTRKFTHTHTHTHSCAQVHYKHILFQVRRSLLGGREGKKKGVVEKGEEPRGRGGNERRSVVNFHVGGTRRRDLLIFFSTGAFSVGYPIPAGCNPSPPTLSPQEASRSRITNVYCAEWVITGSRQATNWGIMRRRSFPNHRRYRRSGARPFRRGNRTARRNTPADGPCAESTGHRLRTRAARGRRERSRRINIRLRCTEERRKVAGPRFLVRERGLWNIDSRSRQFERSRDSSFPLVVSGLPDDGDFAFFSFFSLTKRLSFSNLRG